MTKRMELKKDWTHTTKLTDIRRLNSLYIFTIDEVDQPLLVNRRIFEDRVLPYFMVSSMDEVSREDLMELEWNLYLSKGYFVKAQDGDLVKIDDKVDSDKWYVSFVEIAGPLGDFDSLLKKKNN